MHQTLYRKWRPLTFDDVCGQEHITSILRYQVAQNKTSHAYLFCGSRGTGKTTCAKLLARAINCEHPENGNPCGVCDTCRGILSGAITDVIEMDAVLFQLSGEPTLVLACESEVFFHNFAVNNNFTYCNVGV